MIRRCAVLVLGMLLVSGVVTAAEDATPLIAAHGVIEKVGKETLTIQPRTPGGTFGKQLVLQVTGTSRLTLLGSQMRAGKLVFVQKEVDLKTLKAKQPIAVVYTTAKSDSVLLTAVVQPAPGK